MKIRLVRAQFFNADRGVNRETDGETNKQA
jgi:hypothetical protein